MSRKKIFVCSPTAVTGGPELLHQLVHELRNIGRAAYITYYPFEEKLECPTPYRRYDVPQAKLSDDLDALVIVPETATWIARPLKKAKVMIWWLSVDYYFARTGDSKIRDFIWHFYGLVHPHDFSKRKIPLFFMKKYVHLAQSEYARLFLESIGIDSKLLTDYLSRDHINEERAMTLNSKRNVICYNPRKGNGRSSILIKKYPEFEFIPIQGLSAGGVCDLLESSKIYMDFGNHPGKDRMPREAAMAGCCIITGRRGSAANKVDVPIPDEYKLNDMDHEYLSGFGRLAQDIFENYEKHNVNFSNYRRLILGERGIFKRQVKEIFGMLTLIARK